MLHVVTAIGLLRNAGQEERGGAASHQKGKTAIYPVFQNLPGRVSCTDIDKEIARYLTGLHGGGSVVKKEASTAHNSQDMHKRPLKQHSGPFTERLTE